MDNNLLSTVGMAKKAGRLEIGDEPVGAAARAGQAKLIIVAADAAENTRRRASHLADAGRVKWLCVPFTKAELGGILGRASCAMAAFTDMGFAASLVKKLAAVDSEQYGEAAAQLDTKAQRVQARQAEQRAHEKNLREGKKKPWSPPVPVGGKAPIAKSGNQKPWSPPVPVGGKAAIAKSGNQKPSTPTPAPISPAKPKLAPRGKLTITKK